VTLRATVLLLCFPALAAAAPPEHAAFFDQHCTKCHGAEKQKGDLRLDTLASLRNDPSSAETWELVAEVLETGDMPPKKEPRPDPAAVQTLVSRIASELASATTTHPTALRRMNRYEFEFTVQDLLHIDTPLADLLPEDSSVQGFDNVATGLGISPVLMERYLQAADTAFDSTIRRIKPLTPETRRCVLMERKENKDSVAKNKGGVLSSHGAYVDFTPGWPPARIDDCHPIEDGLYRFRAAVWPHDPGARTLTLAAFAGPLFGPGKRRFEGMFDVTGTPDQPRIIEFTTFLKDNETIHLLPWIYPEHVTWRDTHEKRPGVAILWAETHGPLDQQFPSRAQQTLFGTDPSISMEEGDPVWMRHRKKVHRHHVASSTPATDAERIIRSFLPRAFRRPVDDDLASQFVTLTLDRLEQGRTFEQAVRAGITAVLCSPHFLLLNAEPSLDDYTIATRLSYFLWSSTPDDELLQLAAEGKLSDPAIRQDQVARMIDDPRIERFITRFTDQWLSLQKIEETTPDKKLYPEFDEILQESMIRETRDFFRHILQNNLSIRNFIDSDFTFLNERLAAHYGIEGVTGHEHQRLVQIPEDNIRGGLLTQASILKTTANGTTSSPVLRGVWVIDHLLGQPAPPPPPGVPAVEPDIRGAITIREQLDQHRADPSCARCHHRIDPPGFAMECFDPIGGERSRYRSLGKGDPAGHKLPYRLGLPVENYGTTADGQDFADFIQFRGLLAQQDERVARGIATKLLTYGAGRPLTVGDRASVDAILTKAGPDLGLRSMLHAVVETELFLRP
jgi:hypothetical protein